MSVHGVVVYTDENGDKVRESGDYKTMDEFIMSAIQHKGIEFMSADTIRPIQMRQGRGGK